MYYPGGRTSYSNIPNVTADSRLIDGWALTEVARRMHLAQAQPVDPVVVRQAVTLNLRLWTIFQAGLLEPDCSLPRKLRLNLLALSHFIDQRTARILANPLTESLEPLISVNRGIAQGLLNCGAQSAAPATAQPSRNRRSRVQYSGSA